MEKTNFKPEETKDGWRKTYQMYCSRMEKQLEAAEGDPNKYLGIVFELWAASYRITSDLSMQLEHIREFDEVYGKILPEKEQNLYKEIQQKVSESYKTAELFSKQQEREMTNMMQKVFSIQQDGKEFFGGEDAYERMHILWNGGELMEKLKELIFIDEIAGRDGVEYILQRIG